MTLTLRRRTPEEIRQYDRQRRRQWCRDQLRRLRPRRLFWFLRGEQRQARRHLKLARRTLSQMDSLLWESHWTEDGRLIADYRADRLRRIDELTRVARGEIPKPRNDLEAFSHEFLHPLRHADLFYGGMLDELKFMESPARFAWFIRQIKKP
jgi:hypothetical protein